MKAIKFSPAAGCFPALYVFDVLAFHVKHAVGQGPVFIGFLQDAAADQLIGNITGELVRVAGNPLVDLGIKPLRDEGREGFPEVFDPVTKGCFKAAAGGVKQGNKGFESIGGEAGETELISVSVLTLETTAPTSSGSPPVGTTRFMTE